MTTDGELKEPQVNLTQKNLGIPIVIQNIIHPVIIQGLVKDMKKVDNFIQGMETMYITPHIEEENTTDQQVPAAALHRTANHLVTTPGIMKAIIPVQELIKDRQLDISPDTEVIGSILEHLEVIKDHQDQVAALLLIMNPQPQVQSTVQTISTPSLIYVTMTKFVLQSTAHHLIDVIITNMINFIINMKNICHLRGVIIIKIGKFFK